MLEVGDYVRINKDFRLIALGIGKVIKINQDTIYVKMNFELPFSFKIENIVKHSKNIIDLVEVGDYVNGYKVRGKTNEKVIVDYYCYSEELAGGNWLTFYKDNIKSIVTKEQFKNIEYKVNT